MQIGSFECRQKDRYHLNQNKKQFFGNMVYQTHQMGEFVMTNSGLQYSCLQIEVTMYGLVILEEINTLKCIRHQIPKNHNFGNSHFKIWLNMIFPLSSIIQLISQIKKFIIQDIHREQPKCLLHCRSIFQKLGKI